MKKILVLLGISTILLLIPACQQNTEKQQNSKIVKVDTVTTNSLQSIAKYPGKVKASEDINLSFRVNGTLQRILVKEGAKVKAGQLLAIMDPSDYQVQLAATEAKYQQIKAEAERVIALYNDGGTTPNDYDKAVFGLKQITALYQHHKDELAYTKLYAPFSGTIQKQLFEAHETVGAGMPVLSMVGQGFPEVEINLPSAEFVRRDEFKNYQCSFNIFPGKTYNLKLIGITPKANANQLYTMRLQLTDKDLPMPSPGMNTMVSILCQDEHPEAMQIPTSAMQNRDGKSKVFVYQPKEGNIKAVDVSVLSLLGNGKCIVTSNTLKPGQIIVTAGVRRLQDGEKVKPIPPSSSSNIGELL